MKTFEQWFQENYNDTVSDRIKNLMKDAWDAAINEFTKTL